MMAYGISFFILFMFATIVIRNWDKEQASEKSKLEMRKKQSKTSFRELAMKKKLEELLEKRTSITKKMKMESELIQAGFDLTYGEFRMITISVGIVTAIIFLIAMHNLIAAVILGVIAAFIPKQIADFLRNRRMLILEKQIGSFIKLSIERYSAHGDFAKALRDTVDDFKRQEPMYTELKRMRAELDVGKPVSDVLRDLYHRLGNVYLLKLVQFYEISSDLGTQESRKELMGEVHMQYTENQKHKMLLRKEIAGPKREAFIMMAAIPVMVVYQFFMNPDYSDFMLHTGLGQMGLAGILVVITFSIWFINKKIGAPLE